MSVDGKMLQPRKSHLSDIVQGPPSSLLSFLCMPIHIGWKSIHKVTNYLCLESIQVCKDASANGEEQSWAGTGDQD